MAQSTTRPNSQTFRPGHFRSAASRRCATAAAKRRHVTIAQNPYSPAEKELIPWYVLATN